MHALILAVLLTVYPCARQPKAQLDIIADAIESASRTYDVKPLLLVAMIQHESGCKANVTSSAGLDIGLVQVRLKTGKVIDPSLTRRDLFDPYVNALVATAYLTEQIDKCNSVSRALGAYSSGHCQVNGYSRKVMKTYFQLKKRYSTWKTT